MDSRVALIGIMVEKENSVEELNKLLHQYSGYIVGRMGIPYHKRGVNIISVVIDAPADVISALSGKLGMLDGVTSKAVYSKTSRQGTGSREGAGGKSVMGKQESEKTVTGSDGSGRYERKALIDKLYETQELSREEWIRLIEGRTPELSQYLFEKARAVREREYGKAVYIRGLIECSNYCRNNCYYCGIRRGNQNAQRYRLTADEILSCCENGYSLGFRTFVLQGGEDPAMTDGWVGRRNPED